MLAREKFLWKEGDYQKAQDKGLEKEDILEQTGSQHGARSTARIGLGQHVGDVLALGDLAHISKVGSGDTFVLLLCEIEEGELLVVREGKDLGAVQKPGVVDRGAVVQGLDDHLVLICDPEVVDVYEAVG